MKVEWRIFGALAGFLLVAAIVYGWWTWYELGELEWIGTTAFLLSFLLTGMSGGYFWVVSRRIDLRPEDRPDAEVSDAVGDVGFFSPGSYWPFGIALAVSATGIGLALWLWWLIVVGFAAVIVTAAALVLEYYTGTRRTASE